MFVWCRISFYNNFLKLGQKQLFKNRTEDYICYAKYRHGLLCVFLIYYCSFCGIIVKIIVIHLGYISMGLSGFHVNKKWLWLCGLCLSSLIVNSTHPAMDTWGSCPTSVARSIGARCAHGLKMTPAILSTSLPSWDTRLAWPTHWGKCTALASVCTTGLTVTWMHGRSEQSDEWCSLFVWEDNGPLS